MPPSSPLRVLQETSGFVISAREDQRVLESKVQVGAVAFAQPAKEREESLQFGVAEPAMDDLLGADGFHDVDDNLKIEVWPWLVAPLEILRDEWRASPLFPRGLLG